MTYHNRNYSYNARNSRRRKRGFPWGAALVALVGLLSAVFCVLMGLTKLLPPYYLILLGLLLVALTALVAVLALQRGAGIRTTGMVFGVLACLLLLVGSLGVGRTLMAMGNITNPGREEIQVGIYVRTDDPARILGDMGDYTFGILRSIDRESVDETVAQVTQKLERDIAIAEYDSPAQMVNALLDGHVDAMILNEAYLDVLTETPGFEDVESRVRQVIAMSVYAPAPPSGPSSESTPASPNDFTPVDPVTGELQPFVVYVSGIDSRTGLDTRSRSDVNILMLVNPNTHQILLVSTPRDYFVPLSISDGVKDKLTHAGIYGIDVSMDTLEMLYGININYYFKVHFGGFEEIIDSLGGITVSSPMEFSSNGYHFDEGDNYMDGAKALAFARERYAFIDGDFQRGRNQMAVIKAVINKAMSPSVLTNYLPLLQAVENGFITSVPYDLLATLVREQLSDNQSWNIVSYAVSGYGDYQVTFSQGVEASVIIPDESTVETAKELMKQLLSGQVVEQPE